MANRIAIHHPRALGAHHVEPTAGFWCLRWWRDSHRTITPSGRTRSTNVAGASMTTSRPSGFRVVMNASFIHLSGIIAPHARASFIPAEGVKGPQSRQGTARVFHGRDGTALVRP